MAKQRKTRRQKIISDTRASTSISTTLKTELKKDTIQSSDYSYSLKEIGVQSKNSTKAKVTDSYTTDLSGLRKTAVVTGLIVISQIVLFVLI